MPERRPGLVPAEEGPLDPGSDPCLDVRAGSDTHGFDTHGFDTDGFDTHGFDTDGFDTDGDARADTAVTGDGVDLVLLTDLDGDGFVDRVLRIGPDGVVREVLGRCADRGTGVGPPGGVEAGWELDQ